MIVFKGNGILAEEEFRDSKIMQCIPFPYSLAEKKKGY